MQAAQSIVPDEEADAATAGVLDPRDRAARRTILGISSALSGVHPGCNVIATGGRCKKCGWIDENYVNDAQDADADDDGYGEDVADEA